MIFQYDSDSYSGYWTIYSDWQFELHNVRTWLIKNQPYKGSFYFGSVSPLAHSERIRFEDKEYEMAFKLMWM